jgi:primosomal protein N' (replication factor Y) (superfamily II helicase)
MTTAEGDRQLALLASAGAGRRAPRLPQPAEPLAASNPVAGVVVEVGLAHLDRTFDYAVPASMADLAQPGVRVRVRFAGREVGGYVVDRRAEADHLGQLTPLRRVVSAEVVLPADLLGLCRDVARRWAGSLPDVLRLAVPPRNATAEKSDGRTPLAPPERPEPGPWELYPAGPAFLDRLAAGASVRAVWTALPGPDWPDTVAHALATTASTGRGALLVLPDHRDVDRVEHALRELLGPDHHVRLTADQGPQARYAAWLKVLRGQTRIVIGTRSAALAPVRDLGLVVCWDDGDDLHAEPHAPYWHVREVLALRAERDGAAALFGALTRSAELERLVRQGWARSVSARRSQIRSRAPRVLLAGEGAEESRDPAARTARLASLAWRTARDGLERGPVLVQVPRAGYQPGLACQDCRTPARCRVCHGPLAISEQSGPPACRWCGRADAAWVCAVCEGTHLRSSVVGARRTAEELGRAFPGVLVRTSSARQVVAEVPGSPALVVATPGAEPVAEGGYAAVLLLDGWVPLGRADLRAGEEAVRRWAGAAALARPATAGGVVVLAAPAGLPPVEALIRWDPIWHAERELAERVELGFPPAVRAATVSGSATAVRALVAGTEVPPGTEVLGPVPAGDGERVILRVASERGLELADALRAAQGARSARKDREPVRVQIDPLDLV